MFDADKGPFRIGLPLESYSEAIRYASSAEIKDKLPLERHMDKPMLCEKWSDLKQPFHMYGQNCEHAKLHNIRATWKKG